jgi:hypothetical protein
MTAETNAYWEIMVTAPGEGWLIRSSRMPTRCRSRSPVPSVALTYVWQPHHLALRRQRNLTGDSEAGNGDRPTRARRWDRASPPLPFLR